eukprot:COSAG02_NODE_66018_length_256_cov_0.993631_1_plen_33_part_10
MSQPRLAVETAVTLCYVQAMLLTLRPDPLKYLP